MPATHHLEGISQGAPFLRPGEDPVHWLSTPLGALANGWGCTASIPALFSGASCSLLLEKLFMLTSQGRSEDLAVPALVRGPVCVCVAPLMSLRRATLVCLVMVPTPEPCARVRC